MKGRLNCRQTAPEAMMVVAALERRVQKSGIEAGWIELSEMICEVSLSGPIACRLLAYCSS